MMCHFLRGHPCITKTKAVLRGEQKQWVQKLVSSDSDILQTCTFFSPSSISDALLGSLSKLSPWQLCENCIPIPGAVFSCAATPPSCQCNFFFAKSSVLVSGHMLWLPTSVWKCRQQLAALHTVEAAGSGVLGVLLFMAVAAWPARVQGIFTWRKCGVLSIFTKSTNVAEYLRKLWCWFRKGTL